MHCRNVDGVLNRCYDEGCTSIKFNTTPSTWMTSEANWSQKRRRTLGQRIPQPRRIWSGTGICIRSPDTDGLQIPMTSKIYRRKATSLITCSWKSYQFLSKDISKIVENAIFHFEESFKIPGSGSQSGWLPKSNEFVLVQFMYTVLFLVNFHKHIFSSSKKSREQTEKQTNAAGVT